MNSGGFQCRSGNARRGSRSGLADGGCVPHGHEGNRHSWLGYRGLGRRNHHLLFRGLDATNIGNGQRQLRGRGSDGGSSRKTGSQRSLAIDLGGEATRRPLTGRSVCHVKHHAPCHFAADNRPRRLGQGSHCDRVGEAEGRVPASIDRGYGYMATFSRLRYG